jgi:hypothetical protein
MALGGVVTRDYRRNSTFDDAFDDWTWADTTDTYVVTTYDGWDYGDWYVPVLLDLDGDGVDITPRERSTAEFDVDGDGYDENVAWVGPGDGMLVIDLNSTTGAFGPDGIMSRRAMAGLQPSRSLAPTFVC